LLDECLTRFEAYTSLRGDRRNMLLVAVLAVTWLRFQREPARAAA
jgi:hypothetical protein